MSVVLSHAPHDQLPTLSHSNELDQSVDLSSIPPGWGGPIPPAGGGTSPLNLVSLK